MDLDTHDRRLLALLQQDASLTAERLAERVALSPSAIQRRVKRLKADGYILAEVALVDPARVGRPTVFIASLEVERERPELLAALRAWLAGREEIQQAYYVTGTADYVLIVTAPDAGAYDTFMSRLVADNPNVRRFTTNVTLAVVKRSLALPIPAETDAV